MLTQLDPGMAAAGILVGFPVGLTGMGGSSLLTPLLILVFRVPGMAAAGSELVASVAMKLVGSGIHARAGTIRWDVVRLLSMASMPAAVVGVIFLRTLGPTQVEGFVQRAMGLALVGAALSMALRSP